MAIGAIPMDKADLCLRRWRAIQQQGKQVSLLALFVHDGLLTKLQALVLARADLIQRQPFSKYRLVRLLGEGGMALVYEATFKELNARVALKVLDTKFALQDRFRTRFRREAGILELLDHENIIEWRDRGTEDGIDYFAMGVADGVSVLDLIEKVGPLPELLSLQITAQTASALEHMREKGVVHRDMKPANLVLDHEGTIRIIDFGLAKLMTGMREDTAEETTVGTIEYMSPEQACASTDVDIRSDLYSLGCSLFHMLTGEIPFKGTPDEIMYAQVKKPLEFTPAQRAKVSPPVQVLLRRLMQKDPAERYATPKAFLDDLERLCGDVLEKPVDVPSAVGDGAVEEAPIPQGPAPTKGVIPQRMAPPAGGRGARGARGGAGRRRGR